ncbi:MAG: hypothetical protein ABSG25_07540, partial [Bryobacteraceae bacterium]
TRAGREGDSLVVESPSGVGVRWQGPASVDGRPWPVQDGERVWLPPGKHVVAAAAAAPPARALDFTGDLESAASHPDNMELAYSSESRAFAKLDREPLSLTVDGSAAPVEFTSSGSTYMVRLPRGRHNVVLAFRP